MRFRSIPVFAWFVSAVFMVASATYVAAHDHEDHQSEYGGECIVCAVATAGVAKASADTLQDTLPNEHWIKAPRPDLAVVVVLGDAKTNPTRGPPLSVSS